MATEGDKQGKEAVKPAATRRTAPAGAKTASKPAGRASGAAAKPAGRSSAAASKSAPRPAGRAAAKPAEKTAAKPAKAGTKPAAKPAGRSARTAAAAKPERGAKATASKAPRGEEAAADGGGSGVNREMKRMMARREGAADRLKRAPTVSGRKRTKPLTFMKEVRGELGRVAWPTRTEVVTYSMVVLVTVIFFMVVIAGIDYVALKGVLFLIDRGGR
ncbi:MAG TPA: preprotein translocase subunit SecE [Actinomycetota bacterium]|nr:preprotein translocase subunit SecE [Actinomycetota bacterium]